jgi:hypothetical protein
MRRSSGRAESGSRGIPCRGAAAPGSCARPRVESGPGGDKVRALLGGVAAEGVLGAPSSAGTDGSVRVGRLAPAAPNRSSLSGSAADDVRDRLSALLRDDSRSQERRAADCPAPTRSRRERVVLIGSNWGRRHHPAWALNPRGCEDRHGRPPRRRGANDDGPTSNCGGVRMLLATRARVLAGL